MRRLKFLVHILLHSFPVHPTERPMRSDYSWCLGQFIRSCPFSTGLSRSAIGSHANARCGTQYREYERVHICAEPVIFVRCLVLTFVGRPQDVETYPSPKPPPKPRAETRDGNPKYVSRKAFWIRGRKASVEAIELGILLYGERTRSVN